LLFVTAQEISQKCIGCICEAASGCNITVGCDGPVCGPFYITKQYWIDAGRPYINGGQSDNDNEDSELPFFIQKKLYIKSLNVKNKFHFLFFIRII